jgi:hypothetical protein
MGNFQNGHRDLTIDDIVYNSIFPNPHSIGGISSRKLPASQWARLDRMEPAPAAGDLDALESERLSATGLVEGYSNPEDEQGNRFYSSQ